MKVSFAELHAPMFLAGTNLGNKLDVDKRADLSMEYDRDERELYVTLRGVTTCLPSSSVLHYTPVTDKPAARVVNTHATQRTPVNAQVSDPSREVQNPRK